MNPKITKAAGHKGFILRSPLTGPVFRVYDKEGNYKDYDLLHFDLEVLILDEDAHFYEYDIGATLDHAPGE